MGMFDEAAAAPVAPVVVEAPTYYLVDFALPKSWTGKTPKTSLLDWYRYYPTCSILYANLAQK